MNLLIFDIDGTLTQTNQIDSECFQSALDQNFNISLTNCNWENFPHATDSCIFNELYFQHHGAYPSNKDILNFQHGFLYQLQEAYSSRPSQFQEVPGSSQALEYFMASQSWRMAIATGGWKKSALFKLHCIGVNAENIPAAFANDALSREEIMKISIERTSQQFQQSQFKKIIYVGDGIWDGKACKNLGIPFIGISTKLSSQKLSEAGASFVLENFNDLPKFQSILEEIEEYSSLGRDS